MSKNSTTQNTQGTQGEYQGMLDKYVGTVRIRLGLEPETLLYLFLALSMAGLLASAGGVLIKNIFSIVKKD